MTIQKSRFQKVSPQVSFPELEVQQLAWWDSSQTFQKSIDLRKDSKNFSFYDGPPFATGLPHYGHLLAGTLKDIVPRYWTMKGYRVDRRFGWDCHGLPVEYEINKSHNIKSNKDVEAMGIKAYNDACRGIVKRYSHEWKKTVKRVGRWVDMDNAYYTMNREFMDSVWWVFSQLYKQGLVYEGFKVVPYSTGLSTALSNFEGNLNYKTVQDPSVTVKFKINNYTPKKGPSAFALIWTTTPWTLPSNLAIALHEDETYVEIYRASTNETFIAAQKRSESLLDSKLGDEIVDAFPGKKLLSYSYQPVFEFFQHFREKGAFKFLHGEYVTMDSGTGLVHTAPAFGEDDFSICKKHNIPLANPVDDDGVFTKEAGFLAGHAVKASDKLVIQYLKEHHVLFKQETLEHSYPYCWRTDTPLIYRAVTSWFVRVEEIKAKLLKSNSATRWVPDHLKDGRFGNWLENARDWAVSRNRFWGTPIPIWKNAEGEMICVESGKHLEELTGQKVTDLHCDSIDSLEIPSPTGKSPLKRIKPVLDCWFESGSMPYAQWGYPFTNEELCKKNFPADFIAEGLDQTRGWFYTLTVIGAALFNQSPFKNVIVNGLILAEDGKKMSKSLKNYPDPLELIDRHGADALRLYLIDSPVVRAQEIRFSEKGVQEVARKILMRWWNAYSFFVSYANIDNFQPKGDFKNSTNPLDQWLLSEIDGLIQSTETEMESYRLYQVVPKLLGFIESLTNTYIRFNRPHFWKSGMPEDKRYAFETLYYALMTLSKIMAPFAPFLSEEIYRNLRSDKDPESVHLCDFPKPLGLEASRLSKSVSTLESLMSLGRNLRERFSVQTKIPLKKLTIYHRDHEVLNGLKTLSPYIMDELNVREIQLSKDEHLVVNTNLKPNFPILGKKAGPRMKELTAAIRAMSADQIESFIQKGSAKILGFDLDTQDLDIEKKLLPGKDHAASDRNLAIELDPQVDAEQLEEGLFRELMRKVQLARKNMGLELVDRISVSIESSEIVLKSLERFKETFCQETLTVSLNKTSVSQLSYSEEVTLEVLKQPESAKIGISKAS